MNAQEALNKNWQHFIVEGNPPGMAEGECRLRGGDGAKCAIGVLIPEDDYGPELEHMNLHDLGVHFPHLPGAPGEEDTALIKGLSSFLECLQTAHDSAATSIEPRGGSFRTACEHNLRHLANKFNLEVPEND